MIDSIEWKKIGQGNYVGALSIHDPREGSPAGRLEIPVGMIERGNGPTAMLMGGVHGDEPAGPICLIHLFERLAVMKNMAGRIIICPAANIPAIKAESRFAPQDHLNMNRCFPGDAAGTITPRICDQIYSQIAQHADCLVDVHSGGRGIKYAPAALFPITGDAILNSRCLSLAKSFNSGIVHLHREQDLVPTHLTACFQKDGKPAVMVEVGGTEYLDSDLEASATAGFMNMLVHINIVQKREIPHKTKVLFVHRKGEIYTPYDSYFTSYFEPGAVVSAKSQIGCLRAFDKLLTSDNPEPIYAPHDSLHLVSRRSMNASKKGDLLYQFGSEIRGSSIEKLLKGNSLP